jgi:branched-chain amino acid aminotransferase
MNQFLHFNGSLIPVNQVIVTANNRGLRYGDGLFETIKLVNGHMPLFPLHVERLMQGMATLQMSLPDSFTAEHLQQNILTVCERNHCTAAARVRVSVFRGNGTLFSVEEAHPSLVIQAEPLPDAYLTLNDKGWKIEIYPDVKKSCDLLSNLKSNNYLPYIMAAMHAQRHTLNDCLILNAYDRICDATIANIFWIHHQTICTPPLSEGGVAGVMRRYLLNQLQQAGYTTLETTCTEKELLQADEVFLTNALYGIRWVQQFREKIYGRQLTTELYDQFVKHSVLLG